MGRIISVISGKGGVGKSTVALNLSAALAGKYGARVALVDLNLSTPHIAAMAGIGPSSKTLEDVLCGKAALSSALHVHESGAEILPSSISPRKLTPGDLGQIGPVLRRLKSSFDYVILDSSPGLGKESMLAMRYGDDLLYVSTPTVPSLMDVMRCKKAVSNLGKNHLGLILNMVAAGEAQLSAAQASSMCDLAVLESIPHDKSVARSLAFERSVVYYDLHSPAAGSFLSLGAKISGKRNVVPRGGSVRRILRSLYGGFFHTK